MIIASAPGRCSLVGNPTDMYGGSVISCSTPERAHCTLDTAAGEMTLTVSGRSQTLRSLEDLTLRPGDPLNIARAALAALEVDPASSRPFHLQAGGDAALHADLAGPTALLTTIVGCVLTYLELRLNRYQIAELVRKIEYDVLQIVCGFQDHYMAVFGGINYMDFRGKNSAVAQDGTTPLATVEPLEDHLAGLPPLLLAQTGVECDRASNHASLRDRWGAGEKVVVDGYSQVARLARLGKPALLACAWEALAELMNHNHAIIRDLGGSDGGGETLIAAALAGGALGAKLAGTGGTILVLTEDRERTTRALLDVGVEKILTPTPAPGLTVEVRA